MNCLLVSILLKSFLWLNGRGTLGYNAQSSNLTDFPTGISIVETAINVNDNFIDEIKPTDLNSFIRLWTLRMSSNLFSTFPYLTDVKGTLKELELNSNPLNTIAPDDFLGFERLQTLHLSACGLTEFPVFGPDVKLTLLYLDLSKNSLTTVESDRMLGFQEITFLTLSNNVLQDFPDFGDMKLTIETLDLSNNRIITISSQLFEGFLNLQFLKMSQNMLTEMPELGPDAKNTLLEVSFDNNAIESMAANSLLNFQQLNILKLEGNQIKSVPSLCTSSRPTISLHPGNNVVCDCRMRELWYHSSSAQQIVCSTPDELANTFLQDVSLHELTCDELSGSRMKSMMAERVEDNFYCAHPPIAKRVTTQSLSTCMFDCLQFSGCIAFNLQKSGSAHGSLYCDLLHSEMTGNVTESRFYENYEWSYWRMK